MNMKEHILAALREQYDRWEELLRPLTLEQITVPLQPSDRSIKDIIAHLWAWQQRSIARAEAAILEREPQFPQWPGNADPDAEGSTDQTNEWIFETYRELPWQTVHQNWAAGFQRFLELSGQVPEIDLLDWGRYPWLDGYPHAFILLATYNHHQEHYDKLQAWLHERGIESND